MFLTGGSNILAKVVLISQTDKVLRMGLHRRKSSSMYLDAISTTVLAEVVGSGVWHQSGVGEG